MALSLIVSGLTLFSIALIWRQVQISRPSSQTKSVAIVVLGDIGRSPRMTYHAQSFADAKFMTYIVGYRGSTPPDSLLSSPYVRFVFIREPPKFIAKLPKILFVLLAPLKVFLATVYLFWALAFDIIAPPGYILVQNPPAIPTLPVVQAIGYLRGCRVIIDWHNTGSSMLALRLGKRNPVVLFAEWIEKTFGRDAAAHLFVSEGMRTALSARWRLRGRLVVFHDRPPKKYQRLSPVEAHQFYASFPLLSDPALRSFFPSFESPKSTPFTFSPESTSSVSPLKIQREDRPALVMSSTSWTADEVFSILLDALSIYEKAAGTLASQDYGKSERLPKLFVVITGKGPMKAAFAKESKLREERERWEWVRCRTAWLQTEDYPNLLGAVDLGISLHTSSSGFDLPMKVVDMFGSGTPVLAMNFPCIGELVQDGKNGRVFENTEDLADKLVTLLKSFPQFPSELDILRAGIKESTYGGGKWCSWEESWERIIYPLVAP